MYIKYCFQGKEMETSQSVQYLIKIRSVVYEIWKDSLVVKRTFFEIPFILCILRS